MASKTLPHLLQHGAIATADVRAAIDQELNIAITPRGGVTYFGTAAQLMADGLVPPGLDWNCDAHEWAVNGFEYTLERWRPDGVPVRAWRAGLRDHWRLQCEHPDPDWYPPAVAARMWAAGSALEHEFWVASPEYGVHWAKLIRARDDSAFQRVLKVIVGT